jgi:hypothetical protein
MPRVSQNINHDTLPIAKVANFKTYTTDSIRDYKIIFKELMFYLKDSIIESAYNKLANRQFSFDSLPDYPIEHEIRIYAVAAIDRTMLFLLDNSTFMANNLMKTLKHAAPSNIDLIADAYYLFPRVFIFWNESLMFNTLVFPDTLAELMAVFSKDNLVQYSEARRGYLSKRLQPSRRSTGI